MMPTSSEIAPAITDRLKANLSVAEGTARARGSSSPEAEDVLLAMLDDGGGVACKVLARLGVDRPHLVRDLQAVLRDQPGSGGLVPELLTVAGAEARALGHSYVGTEHLLIGIAGGQITPAATVLAEHGVTVQAARSRTAELLGREVGR